MRKNPTNVEAIYPLTPMQQGMLFHSLYAPQAEAYFVQFNYKLSGKLDVQSFKRAWQFILERHAVLRTLFSWGRSDKMFQVVRSQVQLPWQELDWRSLSQDEQVLRLQNFLVEDRARGFNLTQAPLLRLTLIRMQDDSYNFIVDFHHILLDGWSVALVLKELFSVYDSLSRNQPPQLPPTRPFRDYILYLQQQSAENSEQFWRQYLKGFARPTRLPLQSSMRAGTTIANATGRGEGATHSEERLNLTTGLTARVREMARQQQVTLNTVIQGAWALVLSAYSSEREVVFGAVGSGRPAEMSGVEEMVGLFINTVAVRVRVEGESRIGEWIKELQREQVEIRRYEHTALVQVQRYSDVPAELPLFESIYAFANYPVDASSSEEDSELKIEAVHSVDRTNYPLDLAVVAREGIHLKLSYDVERFEGETIRRLLSNVETVLEAMTDDPARRLRDISLLGAEERRRLLVEWNQTACEYDSEACLHQLFAEQVEHTPERCAAVFDEHRLSYRELNSRANRLARYLQKRGVGPDVTVGLLMERSVEMLVGLLAILKAGGAYVPLDPAYPSQRLDYMLKDARAAIVLTEQHLSHILPDEGARVVCMDQEWPEIEKESADNPLSHARPENLAYVIYTSGSTGEPKGVAVAHRSAVNLLTVLDRQVYGEGHRLPLRVSLNGPLAFDTSVKQLIQLLRGHTLYVLPQDVRLDGTALLAFLRTHRLDVLDCTPAQFRILLAAGLLAAPELLPQYVLLGGEPIDETLWQTLSDVAGANFYNLYGPTECTVDVTIAPVKGARPTIGRTVANAQVYLLDEHMRPVPVGATGELYVGGAGLARGYYKCPELTSVRFVPDPFGERQGARLYRTGDMARYLPDGQIEYIGRADNQVKVRGFRVEPGEIEAVLISHPYVREAVVLAREDEPGHRRLVAYLVTAQDMTQGTTELRDYLAAKLPDYMIPAAFVFLDSLPLSPNGKLDRQALPAPDASRPLLDHSFAAAQSPAEQVLAEVWSQVLGLSEVGVHDNFFELGGDSILSIQIIARANSRGLHLTPRQLFDHPTIAELAAMSSSERESQAEQGRVIGKAPLTPIQRNFFERNNPEPHHFNQAFMFNVKQGTQTSLVERALQKVYEQHDALRLRFKRADEGWIQHHCETDSLSLERINLTHLAPEEQPAAIEREAAGAQASLNLSEGPLVRALHFDLGAEQEGRLLLVIHHLVVDGVSWRILLEDMQRAYEQVARAEKVELGAKSSSYRQWALALAEYAQSAAAREELAYWSEQEWASAGRLRSDDSEAENNAGGSCSVERRLSEEETRALLQEVPEVYHTQINEVLLTALARAFSIWSGEQSLLVSMEGHGREEVVEGIDLSRTVGWFTSIYPLLLQVSGGEEVGSALKRVKEEVRRIPQKGIGYGVLKYLSQDAEVQRRMNEIPEAEVSFNYLGQFDQVLESGGILKAAAESVGPSQSAAGKRRYELNVDSVVTDGCLDVRWSYGGERYRQERIEELAEQYMEELRGIIAHCQSPDAGEFTPSDFPLANLNEETLGRLSSLLGRLAEK